MIITFIKIDPNFICVIITIVLEIETYFNISHFCCAHKKFRIDLFTWNSQKCLYFSISKVMKSSGDDIFFVCRRNSDLTKQHTTNLSWIIVVFSNQKCFFFAISVIEISFYYFDIHIRLGRTQINISCPMSIWPMSIRGLKLKGLIDN